MPRTKEQLRQSILQAPAGALANPDFIQAVAQFKFGRPASADELQQVGQSQFGVVGAKVSDVLGRFGIDPTQLQTPITAPPLNAQQTQGLNIAQQRIQAGTASPTDITNVNFAQQQRGFVPQAQPAPVAPPVEPVPQVPGTDFVAAGAGEVPELPATTANQTASAYFGSILANMQKSRTALNDRYKQERDELQKQMDRVSNSICKVIERMGEPKDGFKGE